MESNDKLEQLLEQMYAQESLHDKDIDTKDIIDEEWTKFEAEHFPSTSAGTVRDKRSILKIAAMFIGILMISGIAYAAVQMISSQERGDKIQETAAVANTHRSTASAQLAEQDSVMQQPVIFEDAELSAILREVATFYQCEPVYKNEKAKHVRLYFTWDKTKPIDEVVETFNKFERFHITRENQKLIVE